jgi:16S rRNA (guanine966-N2)-methyltransferase
VYGLVRLFQGVLHWVNLTHGTDFKPFLLDLRMRVTGGESRGRVLKVPQTDTVRPTTDKMRQQLFNMLTHSPWAVGYGFDLVGAHVFDGFCGTGALGIEALSRGAQTCVFVDYDARVLQFAKDNVKMCKYDAVSTFLMKGCQKMGPRPDKVPPRNLILLDPPYRKDFIAPALASLVEGGWLSDDALVVAESERGWVPQAPANLTQAHVRIDGDSQLNVWHAGGA